MIYDSDFVRPTDSIHPTASVGASRFAFEARTVPWRAKMRSPRSENKHIFTLLMFVRHSREVVSKDELMKALWPDAFVEEANLSQNIFMLRKALGETPEDRRYIVTLPGRGYRFAEEVRTVTPDSDDLVIESRSRTRIVIEQAAPTLAENLPALQGSTLRKSIWNYFLPVVALLALAALGAVFLLRRARPVALGEKDTVLVADFTNTTGDPVFDGTLRQGLEVQLEQSPYLSLVSEDHIQQVLRMMGQPAEAKLTPEIARDLCQRTASAAVIKGSIAEIGTQYLLILKAVNCVSGESLASTEARAVWCCSRWHMLGRTRVRER
jgi:DNA-binding winged helix-turn-helix (wHTH) protein